MYTKKIEEKVPGKVGECIFDSQKCKSFQGPKAGPGPQPIFYGSLRLPDFTRQTSLHYVSKISEKFSRPPPDQILDPLLKVLLSERKRHTAHRVASPCGGGGVPTLARGYPAWPERGGVPTLAGRGYLA